MPEAQNTTPEIRTFLSPEALARLEQDAAAMHLPLNPLDHVVRSPQPEARNPIPEI
jgi:hypothetical protein